VKSRLCSPWLNTSIGSPAKIFSREQEQRHVRPAPRPIDGEESEAGDGKPVEMRVGMRHLRARGITPRIARRGIESSEHLGKHRWVVARTLAWFNRFRRVAIRDERHADLYRAFLLLTAAVTCFRTLKTRFC
jgi:IS5 family transposase